MPNKKFVYLHVPYPRLVKHAFSKPFIDLLSKRFNVKILSPFKITKEDLVYLGLNETQFVYYETNFNALQTNIFRCIDYFRRSSFFLRNKDKLRLSTYANLLADKKYPSILRLTAKLMFRAKLDKMSWKILDRALWRLYTPAAIRKLDFECDLLLQFSNWGINDYAIKNARFVKKAQKVLFPYTTDQIYATGHFLYHFDKIYCQSQIEFELLDMLHDYDGYTSIAGSLWFRHIDYLLENEIVTQLAPKTIVYAGVSSEFFPKTSEVNFVKKLEAQFPQYNVTYLPYFTENENTDVLTALNNRIEVKMHETAITELSTCAPISVKKSIIRFLEKINGASLFVMSYNTSMSLDFSYLNQKNVFSYFYDETGKVELGAYGEKERVFFHGPNYHEIDLAYQFGRSDFLAVDDPASNRWDSEVQLEKIVEELENIA